MSRHGSAPPSGASRRLLPPGAGRIAAAILAAICVGAPALAQSPVTFAGKRVTVSIGFSPVGIGYDTYGRELAKFLPKYLPGNPAVVAENKPGAGSMTLLNTLYNAAPKDGTEISVVGRGAPMDALLTGEKTTAKFDATKFNWIGSMNNEVAGFFVRRGAPVSGLDDILAGKPIQVGSAGAGSDMQIFGTALNAVLGTKLNLVPGYPGMNEILLAMLKGEMDGVVGYSWSAARVGSADQLKSGEFRMVMQLALDKHRDLPDVPLVMDLVRGADEKALFRLIFARQAMGRPVVAPPGLDPRVVAVLRKAFDDVHADPEFIAETTKIGLEINRVGGDEVQKLVDDLFATPRAVVSRAQKILAN